jgi:hypothetical protein
MAGTAFSPSNWDGYDEQSVANPGSALTDFTLIIDISDLSASWKGAVQSDGGDIRCTKGDDTELPLDVIDWDYGGGSPTGFIRVKWSGSLSDSGTQNVRVYAGHGSAVMYDANETYGSDNAYDDDWVGYWPNGGGTDRTSGGHDADPVSAGNPTVGGESGQIGKATAYDGENDYCVVTNHADLVLTEGSIFAWISYTSNDAWQGVLDRFDSDDGGYSLSQWSTTSSPVMWARYQNTGNIFSYGGTMGGGYQHLVGTFSGTNTEVWIDNSSEDADSGSITISDPAIDAWVGRGRIGSSAYWEDELNEVQLHSSVRSDDWIAEEYSQTNDNATFWGSWSWTELGGAAFTSKKHGILAGCGYIIGG